MPNQGFYTSIYVNPEVLNEFTSFEVDTEATTYLSELMGADEAISRRAEIYGDIASDLAINISASKPKGKAGKTLGRTYHSRKKIRGQPPADIQIFPLNLIDHDLVSTENPAEYIEEQVSRAIIHEISHFTDPVFDTLYHPGLSRLKRRSIYSNLLKSEEKESAKHPSVIKDRAALEALLPTNRMTAKAKVWHEAAKQAILEAMLEVLGITVEVPRTSIVGLKRTIKINQEYWLLRRELLARTDEEIYKYIGRLCRVEIRHSVLQKKPRGLIPLTPLILSSTLHGGQKPAGRKFE